MSADGRDIAIDAADVWPDYRPTRLIELPGLARVTRVARVLAKMECERPLGNFKALGGMMAALRALARVAGVSRLCDLRSDVPRSRDADELLHLPTRGLTRASERRGSGRRLPDLVCASAGNHGLAVAAAARWAGTCATVYLSESANRARAARLEALGARVVWTPGTYDDAVERAAHADGLLIADTSEDPDDRVVRDVLDGYSLISRELAAQLGGAPAAEVAGNSAAQLGDVSIARLGNGLAGRRAQLSADRPTHLFVQAGVGGLAAALTAGLRPLMRDPGRVLVVEPESAACVAAALSAGEPVRIAGELRTSAEMLACGVASAPAVKVLREHGVASVLVAEELLQLAARRLHDFAPAGDACNGERLLTTPSGATGLAGLLHVSSRNELRNLHQLSEESCVLLVITEGAVPSTATIFGTS